jgi:hypothetical protein
MTYQVNPITRMIAGDAPAGINSTTPRAPHTLQISIAGETRQVTTDASGHSSANFSSSNYVAGLVGAMDYVTPDSDHLHCPFHRGRE